MSNSIDATVPYELPVDTSSSVTAPSIEASAAPPAPTSSAPAPVATAAEASSASSSSSSSSDDDHDTEAESDDDDGVAPPPPSSSSSAHELLAKFMSVVKAQDEEVGVYCPVDKAVNIRVLQCARTGGAFGDAEAPDTVYRSIGYIVSNVDKKVETCVKLATSAKNNTLSVFTALVTDKSKRGKTPIVWVPTALSDIAADQLVEVLYWCCLTVQLKVEDMQVSASVTEELKPVLAVHNKALAQNRTAGMIRAAERRAAKAAALSPLRGSSSGAGGASSSRKRGRQHVVVNDDNDDEEERDASNSDEEDVPPPAPAPKKRQRAPVVEDESEDEDCDFGSVEKISKMLTSSARGKSKVEILESALKKAVHVIGKTHDKFMYMKRRRDLHAMISKAYEKRELATKTILSLLEKKSNMQRYSNDDIRTRVDLPNEDDLAVDDDDEEEEVDDDEPREVEAESACA